ncbi:MULTISPECIES: serine/threonine-protein kinase [unclassified Streptomyces]|uniref:serine/threonine-protein kinase n=1 Tax=unclassified Streptomyces TaxID=2593676 RepID=UPI0036C6DC49
MTKFRKVAPLDEGAQGMVWKAKRVGSDELVALKYLRFESNSSRLERSNQKKRFIREVESQRKLIHPGIMPVLACATNSSTPWYAMPLADGSLQEYFDEAKKPIPWVMSVMKEVMDAIEYAHEHGVIHRDLKPNNILHLDGKWLISDFGYCRRVNSESAVITEKNHLVGSMAYAAPEQYDDAHVATESADIYSLAKILIHLLTWQTPFPYSRIQETPRDWHDLLRRCLAENPRQRPQKVADFRLEVLPLLTGR